MRYVKVLFAGILILSAQMLSAQTDKSEVRKGNREYRKGEFKEAEIDYRRALVKDSLSFAANYNLACDLYRQEQYDEAGNYMKKIADQAAASTRESDYYYNLGDIALAKQDYNAFEKALLLNPGDMDAKENYVYAKMMLQNQQNQQNQDNQDNQNQDQNQDQDDQNQNQDQKQNDQNQDENNNQNQDQQDQSNDQNRQNQSQQQQDAKISPQAAQQMLQAIQAREKETQDKVNREKAAAMKSRQKEKNW